MAYKVFQHLRAQWLGALALLMVLTGGTAAVNSPSVRAGDYAAATTNRLLGGEVFVAVGTMGSSCVFGVTGTG